MGIAMGAQGGLASPKSSGVHFRIFTNNKYVRRKYLFISQKKYPVQKPVVTQCHSVTDKPTGCEFDPHSRR